MSFNHFNAKLTLFKLRATLKRLTEEVGQPQGLVVVNDGDTQRVESHQAQHCPVESVCLHHTADGDAQQTLLAAKIRCWTSLGTPDTCSGHGDALGDE